MTSDDCFFPSLLITFLNTKISVNWSKLTHKMTIFFLSSFFYLQFLLQKFKSPHLEFFFKITFCKFFVNQPTAVLNCTILEGWIALHCTDMWQVISWHVKCVSPSPSSVRMYVLLSIPPYVHMYFSPSKKFYFGIGTSICIGWEIQCLLNAEFFLHWQYIQSHFGMTKWDKI